MSLTFPLSYIAEIDGAIQDGRGAAASVLGQGYTVHRLNDTTNGSISNNTPLYLQFPARLRHTTSKAAIENTSFDILVFQATCDNRKLEIGDLCVQTGYVNDGSVFTVAQKRPTRETLWIRTESACSLSRPKPFSGQAAQNPATRVFPTPGYSGIAKSSEWFLTLNDGLYSYTSDPNAQVATVYCGLQPTRRIRDGNIKMPTALYREQFLAWLPMLPGEVLSELDRVRFPNQDAYEIALIFSTDVTGLAGHICLVERINV